MMVTGLNALLDTLPHTRLGRASREVPAFRTCGIVGFYVALVTLFAGGLVTGRSLIVLAALALVCGLSFFAYAHLRRAVVGHELIVLLEHVWFTQMCVAAALWGLGEPLPPYLDLIVPPLALFLACGRVGCLMVGCCHGNPSSLGIVYPEAHAEDGFSRHLVGVRLFPVALVECAGLVLIGVTGFAALPFAAPGRVFLWLLIGYAVMRFGLEGIRGDSRPHFLGLSQARWMSLAEFGLALWLAERWSGRPFGPREIGLGALLMALLAGCLALKYALDPRRNLLAPAHLRETRALALAEADEAPSVARSTRGVALATSDTHDGRHVSLSLPSQAVDVMLLCELAAAALPDAPAESARVSPRGVLHVDLPATPRDPLLAPEPRPARAAVLRAHAARASQHLAAAVVIGEHERLASEAVDAPRTTAEGPRLAYFGSGRRPQAAEA